MSRKRKRRRRGGPRGDVADRTGSPAATERGTETTRRRPGAPSPMPPLGRSLARGLSVAAPSLLVMGTAFLATLALWGVFLGSGVALSSQGFVYLLALPPLPAALDLGLAQALFGSPAMALAAMVGLGIVRAILLGFLALLLWGALQHGSPDPRSALRSLPRTAISLFGVYGAEVGMFLLIVLFLQPVVGTSAAFAVLILGIHFLGFAPAVAAAEPLPAGAVLRLALRASRLPGARHLVLAVGYFVVVVYGGVAAGFLDGARTPSVVTWLVALAFTFVHLVALGAFLYRWQMVRDHVVGEAPPAREGRRGGRPPQRRARGR